MPPKKFVKEKGAETIAPKVKDPSRPKEVEKTKEENKTPTEAPQPAQPAIPGSHTQPQP